MSRNKVKYSIHHCIPKSRTWTNADENKQLMNDNEHVNLHRFFNNFTPAEEIFKVLATNKKVRSDKFANDILKVLDNNFDNYYKEWTHWDIQWERWQLMELERKFGRRNK